MLTKPEVLMFLKKLLADVKNDTVVIKEIDAWTTVIDAPDVNRDGWIRKVPTGEQNIRLNLMRKIETPL